VQRTCGGGGGGGDGSDDGGGGGGGVTRSLSLFFLLMLIVNAIADVLRSISDMAADIITLFINPHLI
jgi:hypothetical protein